MADQVRPRVAQGSAEWLREDTTEAGRFLWNNALYHEGISWGFILVRTSHYGPGLPEKWTKAISKLCEYVNFGIASDRLHKQMWRGLGTTDDRAEKLAMDKFEFLTIEDEKLADADDQTVRTAVEVWKTHNLSKAEPKNFQSPRAFVAIDQVAMEMLALAPTPTPHMWSQEGAESLQRLGDMTVKMVDLDYADAPGSHDEDDDDDCDGPGSFYRGCMQAEAMMLYRLYDLLSLFGSMKKCCPRMESEDQIPVFDGDDGRVLDASGAVVRDWADEDVPPGDWSLGNMPPGWDDGISSTEETDDEEGGEVEHISEIHDP